MKARAALWGSTIEFFEVKAGLLVGSMACGGGVALEVGSESQLGAINCVRIPLLHQSLQGFKLECLL